MASRGTAGEAECTTSDFRCVQCGFPVKTLYIQYSPGNIRLVKCGNCKAVADGYIECEIMILILDLILHKPKAYRHVFYNMFSKETANFESLLWKLALMYGMLDIYKMWVLSSNEKEYPMPASFTSFLLELGKMVTGVMFGNLVFLCVLFCGTRKLLSATTRFYGYKYDASLLDRWKQILFVVVVSSYFKIFLLAMMVWEFPSSVIVIIDIFVLSSNTVALKGVKYCDHQLSDDEMLAYLCLSTWDEVPRQSEQSVRPSKLSDRNGIDDDIIQQFGVPILK